MKTDPRLARCAAAIAVAGMIASSAPVIVQAANAPGATQPANGIPDFSTNRKMWVLSGGGFRKVPGDTGPGPIEGTNKYRPKIVDPVAITDNPLLQPWAKKVMDAANQKVIGGEQGYEFRNDHWEEDICAEAGDGLIPVPGLAPMPHTTKRDF